MATPLYHLVPKETWEAAQKSGNPYFPKTYDQDGFIHLTADPLLLMEVANRFYKDEPGDWIVLVINPVHLKAKVKYETAAPVGDKEAATLTGKDERQWPHLYGTIDYDAVTKELPVARDADGTFLSVPVASNEIPVA